MSFYTKAGTLIAEKCVRVVHGDRGDYMEFAHDQVVWEALEIPKDREFRLTDAWKDRVYYIEYRSKDEARVKVYDQRRTVAYANYKVGFVYIAPGDLLEKTSTGRRPIIGVLDFPSGQIILPTPAK